MESPGDLADTGPSVSEQRQGQPLVHPHHEEYKKFCVSSDEKHHLQICLAVKGQPWHLGSHHQCKPDHHVDEQYRKYR